MRTVTKRKLKMVTERDPQFFEQAFNEAMEELKENDPVASDIECHDGMWWCAITYEEKEKVMETVADEFAMQGIRYLCKNCPLHDVVTDGRVKTVPCRYSEHGVTHLEHCACEYFYKMLKQNKVEPLGY